MDPFTAWLTWFQHHGYLVRLIELVAAATLVSLVARAAVRAVTGRVQDGAGRYQARKAIGAARFALIAVVALAIFSDRLGSVSVALGVAGAGITFALQEVIVSFAGWLAIAFGDFYKPGDRVQLGGIRGDVIDIGLLRTTLMEAGEWVDGDLYSGRIVRIANSFVFKEPVFNYSADFPFLWDEITVPITYGCDPHAAKALLTRCLQEVVGVTDPDSTASWQRLVRKYLIEPASLDPMVTLVATDNWLEFTLRYTVPFRQRRRTKDALFLRILDAIAESDGAFSFASATFQLVGAPPLDVRLTTRRQPPV